MAGPGGALGLHQVMSPKPAPAKMEPKMQRRKATPKELEQGQREIEEAQRRLDQQGKDEVALEDGKVERDSKEAETPIPPEENMERVKAITEGPQSSKAASPEEIRPLKNAPEEPGATKETKVAVAAEGVLPSPQSAPFQRTSKAAASDLKTPEKKDEEGQHGVGSVEKSVAPQSDPKMSEPPHMSTPMTPLFDENQVRRFQELYAQAPWLFPQNVPQAPLSLMRPGQFLPPVQRPLFLEQDERRMHEEGRVGSSGFHGHGHDRSMDVDRENRELRRNLEKVLRENQLLRERVDALEFQKLDEDQRFATPNGSDGQLERPPKRRLIDPQKAQGRQKRLPTHTGRLSV